MDKIKNYNVSFSGLNLGKHTFKFRITQAFFELFDFNQDFRNPAIDAVVELEKHSNFLDLKLNATGEVEVDCDVTDEPYQQPIDGELALVVKFGQTFDDSDDEVWTIPHGEHEINVAQLIYELVLLSIPNKRVNPNLDSEKAQEALDLLDKYAPKASAEENIDKENDSTDPRWDSLKDLFKKK